MLAVCSTVKLNSLLVALRCTVNLCCIYQVGPYGGWSLMRAKVSMLIEPAPDRQHWVKSSVGMSEKWFREEDASAEAMDERNES